MRILSALFAVLFWASAAFAVELSKEDETIIRNQIVSVMTQYNSGNVDGILNVMPPAALNLFGGRDQMKTILTGAMQAQKAQKASFETYTTGTISKPFMAGTTTLCYVSTESMMKIGDKRVRAIGFMIASRAQGESQWKLLGGDGLAKAPQLLSLIFPGAPENPDLPPLKYEVIP